MFSTTTKTGLSAKIIMRSLFILTALFFAASGWSQTTQFTSYIYKVGVHPDQATKTVLGAVTDDFPQFTNRRGIEGGFSFRSATSFSEAFITELFAAKGIALTSFECTKESVAVSEIEKLGGNNCELAEQLCSGASLSGGATGYGTQELGTANRGCLLGNEHQSSWYYLNVQTAGNLAFTINPVNNGDDYDFAVWGPFTAATAGANCPPVNNPIRCSWYNNGNGSGNTGLAGTAATQGTSEDDIIDNGGWWADGYVREIPVLANEIYILLIDNYSITLNPYGLTFGGSAVLGCTPVVLPVELSSFTGQVTSGGNLIKWTTESEYNSSSYRVDWSVDPASNDWKEVTTIAAAGDSEHRLSYGIVHTTPNRQKVNYYRLVQTDTDGTEHIFNDKMIALNNTVIDTKPVRIINLLGQEVNEYTPGIVIYQFSDGTSMKVMQ